MLTEQFKEAAKNLRLSLLGKSDKPCICTKASEGLCREYEGRPWFGCLKKVEEDE